MKTLIAALAMLVMAVPVALAAEGGSAATSPAQACKTELKTMGATDFKALYAPGAKGTNAMGKCVSKHQRSAAANRVNAAKTCKAEEATAEADFRAAHGGKSFAETYGKNENDKNAYGKCVSSKASKADTQQEAATLKASKACKAERGATTESRAAFTAKYGGKASSAFGKCVSSKSKTQ
jgi:hypothetical protein